MGFDSVCGDTGLILGLSLNSSSPIMVRSNDGAVGTTSTKGVITEETLATFIDEPPSLTLGLSSDHVHNNPNKKLVMSDHLSGGGLYRQDSTVISGGGSSFSNNNMSLKRERCTTELGSTTEESAERVLSNDNNYNYSSRVVMGVDDDIEVDDDGCVNGRKKLRLTKPQSALLEQAFKLQSSLNPKQKQELARELKLRPRQVEVWFQNRRARTKLKQTEMDFEHLKKCCEKLNDENRRLQRELQELKAMKSSSSQPFYMRLPAATLTMCPSCERIGESISSSTMKNPFTMAANPHFFTSFANPSTAC